MYVSSYDKHFSRKSFIHVFILKYCEVLYDMNNTFSFAGIGGKLEYISLYSLTFSLSGIYCLFHADAFWPLIFNYKYHSGILALVTEFRQLKFSISSLSMPRLLAIHLPAYFVDLPPVNSINTCLSVSLSSVFFMPILPPHSWAAPKFDVTSALPIVLVLHYRKKSSHPSDEYCMVYLYHCICFNYFSLSILIL